MDNLNFVATLSQHWLLPVVVVGVVDTLISQDPEGVSRRYPGTCRDGVTMSGLNTVTTMKVDHVTFLVSNSIFYRLLVLQVLMTMLSLICLSSVSSLVSTRNRLGRLELSSSFSQVHPENQFFYLEGLFL